MLMNLNSRMWLTTIALDSIDFGGFIHQAGQLEDGRPGLKPRSAGFPDPGSSPLLPDFPPSCLGTCLSPLPSPLFLAPFLLVAILFLRDAIGKGEKKRFRQVCFILEVPMTAITIINHLHSCVFFLLEQIT